MPVQVVYQGAGDTENMTDAAKAQLAAAIQAAEAAGLSRVVVTAGREGGHRSHLPAGNEPGTEWDFQAYNPDGSLWSREQRVQVAQGARSAGANRFGFYENADRSFDPMLHMGISGPGRPQAMWGASGLYGGPDSRAYTNAAEQAFLSDFYATPGIAGQTAATFAPNAINPAAAGAAVGMPAAGAAAPSRRDRLMAFGQKVAEGAGKAFGMPAQASSAPLAGTFPSRPVIEAKATPMVAETSPPPEVRKLDVSAPMAGVGWGDWVWKDGRLERVPKDKRLAMAQALGG